MTLTARCDTAPEAPEKHLPNRVCRGHQPSSAALYAHQHEYGAQGRIATRRRIARLLSSPVLRGSQPKNLHGHDADGLSGHAVDQIAANLAAFASSPILGLAQRFGVVGVGRAAFIKGRNPKALRCGKTAGDQVQCGHGENSSFNTHNIGPMALPVNNYLRVPA